MRIARSLLVALLALASLASAVHANDTKPSRNTPLDFTGTGGTRTITVVGTQGCQFSVMAMSSDESVAAVSFEEGLAKKHKVVVQAAGVGSALVTIVTAGENPSCNGFEFSFPVTVVFDEKTFFKEAKQLLSDSAKDAKATAADGLDAYCDLLGEIAAAVDDGVLDIVEGYFEAVFALGDFAVELEAVLDELYEQAWDDLWSGDAQYLAPSEDVTAFYPGGCGEWDKYRGKLNALEDKVLQTATKKFKAFVKVLAKAAEGDDDALVVVAEFPQVLLELDEPELLPGSTPEDEPAPPAPKPLEKQWTSAGRLTSSEVSRLDVGGTADPAAGDVTVTIAGPNGFTTNTTAIVNEDCEWQVSFGELPPGAYTVTLTQGDNGPVAFGTVVP